MFLLLSAKQLSDTAVQRIRKRARFGKTVKHVHKLLRHLPQLTVRHLHQDIKHFFNFLRIKLGFLFARKMLQQIADHVIERFGIVGLFQTDSGFRTQVFQERKAALIPTADRPGNSLTVKKLLCKFVQYFCRVLAIGYDREVKQTNGEISFKDDLIFQKSL